MTCPCCVKYCHAPSPCTKNIRIKVTWGPIEGISTLVTPAISPTRCVDSVTGGTSGTGSFQTTLGTCFRVDVLDFPVVAKVFLGGSQNAFGIYAQPSCCLRTGQRAARIFNGRVVCLVDNGPKINYRRSSFYDFSFATLDAQATVTKVGGENVGDTTPCAEALVSGFLDTPPTLELIVVGNPPDFCDTPAVLGGFPAVSGPYGSLVICNASCGNPLP